MYSAFRRIDYEKSIMSLTKDLNNDELTVEDIDLLYEAVLIAFNKNKEGRKFSEDAIEEIIGFNSLYAFLMATILG